MLEAQRRRPKEHRPYRYDEKATQRGGPPAAERKAARAPARGSSSFYDRVMEFHSARRREAGMG